MNMLKYMYVITVYLIEHESSVQYTLFGINAGPNLGENWNLNSLGKISNVN